MRVDEAHLAIIPRVAGWDQRRFTKEHFVMWTQDSMLYIRRRSEVNARSYHTTVIIPIQHCSVILPHQTPPAPWEDQTTKKPRRKTTKEQAIA